MSLNIKNLEVLRLVDEIVAETGETKTEAIRQALVARRAQLWMGETREARINSFMQHLEEEFWPSVPPGQLGRRLTREEEDEILGFGPHGV